MCSLQGGNLMGVADGAYYAVLPATIRYDPDLAANAKLLYAELTSLCNQTGYCWAGNQYFAELYGLSERTVSRLITQLEDKGYIRCEMAATNKGSERHIYAGVFVVRGTGGIDKNVHTPPDKNVQGGVDKNVYQNNINMNNKQDNTPYSPPEGDAPAGAPIEAQQSGFDGERRHSGADELSPKGEASERSLCRRGDKPQPKPKTRRSRQKKSVPTHAPERFEQFWAFYPGGGSRLKAVAAWDELAPDDGLIDEMARALKRQKKSRQWQDGVGIPHASTWLNQRRWTDKIPETPKPPAPGGWAPDPEVD